MKREVKYILGGVLISIGCFIWYQWPAHFTEGLLILSLPSLFIIPRGWCQYTGIGIPKWNARKFFLGMSLVLGLVHVSILGAQLSREQMEQLFATWYFTGVFWLLCLCLLTLGYIEEKKKNSLEPNKRN